MLLHRKYATGVLVFVCALLMVFLAAQAAQADDGPYTGKPPDYVLHLQPLRARVPAPISVPFVKVDVNARKPADESVAANAGADLNKNKDIQSATSGSACLDFDTAKDWGSNSSQFSVWDDQYAGWGPFGVDDPGLHQIENVVFSKEQSVGSKNASFKLASSQPYAAGLASPIIEVTPGATFTVTVSYYIFNHGGPAKDWASMGVKGDVDGYCGTGCYVNGYARGQWATLTQTATSKTGKAMILLQAESPQRLNSNIYSFTDKDFTRLEKGKEKSW